MDAGRLPRHEGRGRLGRGLHRVLLDQPRVRRDALRVGAAVGRRGHAGAVADDRPRARARRAGRGRAVARRRLRRGPRVAAAAAGAVADRQRPGQRGGAKDDGAGRHPAGAGASGSRPRSGHAAPASTSSTCTGRTPTCPRSSCRPCTTAAPTSTAASSRTARGSGWRRSSWSRRRSATMSRSRCGSPPTRWSCPGVPIEEGLEFIRAADPMVDLWDVVIGSMWGPGRLDSGPSRFFDQGYQMELVGPCPRGDRQADRGGGPVHRPRPDGRPGAGRHRRPDRRGAAVDLGSVPAGARSSRAATTRSASASAATPATRGRSGAGTWAAPRTRPPARSTAAAGIRSGSTAPRTPTGRCWWWAPGRPAWSAPRCSASAAWSWCTWSTAATTSAAACAGSRACPGSGRWGHVIDYRRAQLDRLDNVSLGLGTPAVGGRRARLRRPDRGRGDRLALGRRRHQRRHAAADPRRRFARCRTC